MALKLFVVAAFIISALIGRVAIPKIVVISKKKRLFDQLSDRKVHKGNIPRLGGVAFFPAFLFSVALMMGLRYFYGFNIAALPLENNAFRELMFLIAGSTLVFFIGLTDDLSGLSYKSKFAMQIIVSILFIYSGVGIEDMGGIFGLNHIPIWAGSILTCLVVILLMNAYNLIDGIDGLCSGLALLALGVLGGWFTINNLYVYAIMSMGMAGVTAVFFFYNVSGRKLKIFMGDTGSLTLGYIIAFLGLKFYNLNINTEMFQIHAAPAIFLGIVFIPVFDTLRVFCVRISKGLSPFYPDKSHIHHKVLLTGLTHIQSTLVILALQAGFIGLNILLKNLNINLLFAVDLIVGVLMIRLLNGLGRSHASRIPAQIK